MAGTPTAAPVDPLAKRAAIGVACARLGIGIATFGFTRRVLPAIGFERPDPATVALARLAGGRDIALGLHALAGASDRDRLRESVALGTAVDAGDAAAFGAALLQGEGIARTAGMNAPAGLAAALLGLWILRRL